MPNSKSFVYIVEDDEAIGNALQWLLKSVGINSYIYTNGAHFLTEYNSNWSGCILLDIRMPHMSGLEVQRRFNKLNNKMPIIFITGHGDIDIAVNAMKAGAFDFVTKPFNNQSLLDVIQKAMEFNQKYNNNKNRAFIQGFSKLTPRELEILHYVIEGNLNKQIACALEISISTVEMHRANIMEKLGVKSLASLVKYYVQNEDLLKLDYAPANVSA